MRILILFLFITEVLVAQSNELSMKQDLDCNENYMDYFMGERTTEWPIRNGLILASLDSLKFDSTTFCTSKSKTLEQVFLDDNLLVSFIKNETQDVIFGTYYY